MSLNLIYCFLDFPGGSDGKASAYNAGDPGSIPGLGRSSGEGNGNPFLAWKIAWTEEPGGLQSMGLQRVGHNRIILMGLRYRQSILEKKGDFYQWWGWGPCPVMS